MDITKKLLSLALALGLSTTAINAKDSCEAPFRDHIVHFADEHDNRLLTLNYKDMELLNVEHVDGLVNHHADTISIDGVPSYIMMVPKGSNFVTFRDIKNAKFVKRVNLPFRPRSGDAYNVDKNLIYLNSRDRPAGVLIDTKKLEIVGKVGFNTICNLPEYSLDYISLISNYNNYLPQEMFKAFYLKKDFLNLKCNAIDLGGDQISGHPRWISKKALVEVDRANRLLHIYEIHKYRKDDKTLYRTKLTQTLATSSSMHQIIPRDKNKKWNRFYYGTTEGNLNKEIPAGVYMFKRVGLAKFKQLAFTSLKYDDRIGYFGHNEYITPDLKYLYTPVGFTVDDEGDKHPGGIFVINSKTMKIVKFIEAGYGSGHVAFSKQKGLAIVTNHKSNYLTIIDYKHHKFIKNIVLPFEDENIASLKQSHSQYVSKDGKYYYNFWSDGGEFFRINLDTLDVDGSVYTGGIPIQGNFFENIVANCDLPKPSVGDGYDNFFNDMINIPKDIYYYDIKLKNIPKTVRRKVIKELNDYDDGRFFKKIKHKIKKDNIFKKIKALRKRWYGYRD